MGGIFFDGPRIRLAHLIRTSQRHLATHLGEHTVHTTMRGQDVHQKRARHHRHTAILA